jgi:hypothetical protein
VVVLVLAFVIDHEMDEVSFDVQDFRLLTLTLVTGP